MIKERCKFFKHKILSIYILFWGRDMEIIQKIKDTSRASVASKLLFIVLLNALDGILTYISIIQGYAIELNPLVVQFVDNLTWILIFKIFIPSAMILSSVLFLKKSKLTKPLLINNIVNFALFIYSFVLMNHIYINIRFFHYLMFYN
jgi:hypothetical protein